MLIVWVICVGCCRWIELEFKLVVDVGIVGVLNVGKSIFLSVISVVCFVVVNYFFMMLLLNLGVVFIGYDVFMVVVDLFGFMEGVY